MKGFFNWDCLGGIHEDSFRCQGEAYSIQDSRVSWWRIKVLYIVEADAVMIPVQSHLLYIQERIHLLIYVHMQYIIVLEYADRGIDR